MNSSPELQKEMERQSLIEKRGGLNAESIIPSADVLLNVIRFSYHQPDKTFQAPPEQFYKKMAAGVAGLLERRMSQEETAAIISKFSDSQLKKFKTMIDLNKQMYKEKLGLNGYKGNGESFWQIRNPKFPYKAYPKTITGPNHENVKIQFKEYVTFVPASNEPYEILSEAAKFFNALLRAQQKIQKLAESQNLDISMKFADDLVVLLDNPDSVVLYVPTPEVGKIVQSIIKDEMQSGGVQLGKRKGRSASGFDMKIDGKEFSHRQLTAKAIAKIMTEDYTGKRNIAKYDSKTLAEKIIQRSEQAGKLTPEQILQVI
jgi:hypothetical protein